MSPIGMIAIFVAGFLIISLIIYLISHKRKRKKQLTMHANLNRTRPDVDEKVDKALPPRKLFELFKGDILKAVQLTLTNWLTSELEILKNFPKGELNFDTFNPKAGLLLFKGEKLMKDGHGAFDQWADSDLLAYRESVGTINHRIWGTATLLEIWAADHWGRTDLDTAMVRNAFQYAYGKASSRPILSFNILPFCNESADIRISMDVSAIPQAKGENLLPTDTRLEKSSASKTEQVIGRGTRKKRATQADIEVSGKKVKVKSAKVLDKPKKTAKTKTKKPAKKATKTTKPVAKKAAKKAAPKKAAKRRK